MSGVWLKVVAKKSDPAPLELKQLRVCLGRNLEAQFLLGVGSSHKNLGVYGNLDALPGHIH